MGQLEYVTPFCNQKHSFNTNYPFLFRTRFAFDNICINNIVYLSHITLTIYFPGKGGQFVLYCYFQPINKSHLNKYGCGLVKNYSIVLKVYSFLEIDIPIYIYCRSHVHFLYIMKYITVLFCQQLPSLL